MRRAKSSPAEALVASLGEPDRRDTDLRLLRALSSDADVPARHQDAFDDMLARLLRGQRELTRGQRSYAETIASELGIDPRDPAEKNRDVLRGREVATPGALSTESLKKALQARRRATWGGAR